MNESEYPFCSYKQDCVGCRAGKCLSLNNTEFRTNICPFYKNEKQMSEEKIKAFNRWLELGRFDLLKQYQPKEYRIYLKGKSQDHNDPTAGAAIGSISKEEKKKSKRKLVYICSPFSGDTERNTSKAREYSRFAIQMDVIPVTPHLLYTQFLDDENPIERAMGLECGHALQDKCSEVWVFGDTISDGMEKEISRAKEKCQRVRYFRDIFTEEWL